MTLKKPWSRKQGGNQDNGEGSLKYAQFMKCKFKNVKMSKMQKTLKQKIGW